MFDCICDGCYNLWDFFDPYPTSAIGSKAMFSASMTRVSATAGRLKVFSALRHRNYRLYWFGMLVAITGWQVQMVAQAWLVFQLTNSPFYLGLAGMSQAVPTILLTMFGGVVADRVDRRRLLIVTQAGTGLLMLILATLVATDLVQVWHILLIAFMIGAIWAFDQPARMALVPHLVEREDLMNAVAMGSMIWQGSRIVGPAIGGILIATVGISVCFFLTSIGFLSMVVVILLVKVPRVVSTASSHSVMHNLTEGIGFIVRHDIFLMLIAMTFFNSLFGLSYVTLMPIFAKTILGVESSGYGFLMGASGVGALIGTISIATLGNFKHKGWLIVGGGAMFGVTLFLFSLSRWYYVSLGVLFLSGVVNSLYMTSVNTTLQTLVPDELRGRVMGIYGLTWSLMPLGGMIGGGVATFAGAPFAVGAGGALVAAMAMSVALFVPRVRSL